MDDLEKSWEERSQKYGRKIEGVLTKSFPRIVNLYFHQWMFQQVSKIVDPKKRIKVLDLGCGYGRLSKEILTAFPNVSTIGVDISQTYVKLYNQDLKPRGKAVKSDIRKLQFKNHSFDIVIMVTAFLYIKSREQEKCLKKIFQILRPGGYFVIIERNDSGYAFMRFGELIGKILGKKRREIPTFTFDYSYLSSLITRTGGIITNTQGLPVCTLFLPILIPVGFISESLTRLIFRGVKFLDRKYANYTKTSVYVSYVGNV